MKGRNAVLPAEGEEMPSSIEPSGLVAHIVPEGSKYALRLDLTEWPGAITLREQVLASLYVLAGPIGTWRSAATLRRLTEIRIFVRWCSDNNIHDLDSMSARHWSGESGFVMYCYQRSESPHTRRSLLMPARQVLQAHPGIAEGLRDTLERAMHFAIPKPKPQYYSLQEIESLRSCALRSLAAAERRVTKNYELAFSDPANLSPKDQARQIAFREILHQGTPRSRGSWEAIHAWGADKGLMGKAQRQLFLGPYEGFAAAALLIIATGENLSTLQRRTASDSNASLGDDDLTVYSTVLDKPRRGPRTRFIAENAVDLPGASDQHLGPVLRRIHAATAPARFAMHQQGVDDADQLIVWVNGRGDFDNKLQSQNRARSDSDWLPAGLRLDLAKLHRSVLTRQHKMPTHNNIETFLNDYLVLDPDRREELDAQVSAGLARLVSRARETPLMRIVPLNEAEFMPVTNDTSIASCSDHGKHPETGEECIVNDFLVCLGCRNGVATDRHLPLLVALVDELDRMRQLPAMPSELWENRFALHWTRLCLILRDLSSAQWDDARAARRSEHEHVVSEVLTGRGWEI